MKKVSSLVPVSAIEINQVLRRLSAIKEDPEISKIAKRRAVSGMNQISKIALKIDGSKIVKVSSKQWESLRKLAGVTPIASLDHAVHRSLQQMTGISL